ncbi:hypothetical protein CEB3_c21000 [Peptococcaceae bacterium CEB3]|nr:hypothetical protein CEB3_c21000 [Peptococcaceae bacterium CEB3]
MQDKNTTESTFFQLLGPILSQDLWQKIDHRVASMDRYAKKLKTVQLVELMSWAKESLPRPRPTLGAPLNFPSNSKKVVTKINFLRGIPAFFPDAITMFCKTSCMVWGSTPITLIARPIRSSFKRDGSIPN